MRAAPRLVVAAAIAIFAAATPRADTTPPTLKITSPLGRTGLQGTIRIVASLEASDGAVPTEVRFFVDGVLLAVDANGAPFDTLWVDDNPFAPRELSVEAEFASGTRAHDAVTLKPMEVTEAVEVRSVPVEATVLDANGHFLRDLSSADFELFENDHIETLDLVTQQREPALFTLLIDSSQSMASQAASVRRAAGHLLDPLGPGDRVIVAPFARGVMSVTGPTTDRATVLGAIAAIKPSGGTAILDSIRQVADTLRMNDSRRAVVLITDGYDEQSESNAAATVETLRGAGLTLYVVGVGGIAGISLKGEALLSRLAAETGGRAWFPRDEHRLVEAYAAIASDVQHRYLLTYTPSNQRRDGTWRHIDVRVRRPGATARARAGYTAPIAPPIRAELEFTAVGEGNLPVSITADRLVVRENGVIQKVDTFQEAVLPVTIMLALDSSGSMKKSAEQAQHAAREFVNALRPEDEIGMITFADKSNYIHSPMTRRDYTLKAIDAYNADGGTALYDALCDALAQIGTVKSGRRVVVVVTDGRDENAKSSGPGSLRTWDDVLALQQQAEATIYAVGVGSRVDRGKLQDLASRSGGAAYFPADAATLAGDYFKIVDELRRRYVVGWESADRTRDGAWRRVDISVAAAATGVVLRSRGGYFAPAE